MHGFRKSALRAAGIRRGRGTRHRPRQGRRQRILHGGCAGSPVDHLAVATCRIPGRGGVRPARTGAAILCLAQRIFQRLLAGCLGCGLFLGGAGCRGAAFFRLAFGGKTTFLGFAFGGLCSGAALFFGLAGFLGKAFGFAGFLGPSLCLCLPFFFSPTFCLGPAFFFRPALSFGLTLSFGPALGFLFLRFAGGSGAAFFLGPAFCLCLAPFLLCARLGFALFLCLALSPFRSRPAFGGLAALLGCLSFLLGLLGPLGFGPARLCG